MDDYIYIYIYICFLIHVDAFLSFRIILYIAFSTDCCVTFKGFRLMFMFHNNMVLDAHCMYHNLKLSSNKHMHTHTHMYTHIHTHTHTHTHTHIYIYIYACLRISINTEQCIHQQEQIKVIEFFLSKMKN